MSRAWTTPADIRARVQRRWDDGTLLFAFATGAPFPVVDIPLRGPTVSEISDDLGKVQRWVTELDVGRRSDRRYTLIHAPVGGRLIGRNQLPARAVISSYPQAWALLGAVPEVDRFEGILALTEKEPVVRSWVAEHPLKALGFAGEWPALLAAYRWLEDHRGCGRYLREITAPGADTKLVERHRALLAQLLDVPSSAAGFVDALGLAARPELVRLRVDPALGAGSASPPVFGNLTDLTARVDQLGALQVEVKRALIIENEITFLSVGVPPGGVVVWGRGFEVARAGSLPWLRSAQVDYWGDLDTHGFAILDRLRAWLPQARSLLMDRETLVAHRDRWVREASPTAAGLSRLTPEEASLYADLVADRLGEQVRLEQERIDWTWAERYLR